MFRKFAIPLLVAATVFSSLGAPVSASDPAVVVAHDYGFDPPEITVKVGTTVRWENHEKRQYHSVFFEQLGDKPGDYFFPGEIRERTFDKPGDYPYICEPHYKSHNMHGVVHVTE